MGCFWCGQAQAQSPPEDLPENSAGREFDELPKILVSSEDVKILQFSNLKCFTFGDLRAATRNFPSNNLLEHGAFSHVFKGWIDEHTLKPTKPGTGMVIAVKMFNQQNDREWLTEVHYLRQLHHQNIVKLVGYCQEDEHRLLVQEFMPRGILANHLYGRDHTLSWNNRMKVAIGAGKALLSLHSDKANVIHADFHTSNVLLDTDYNAKLSNLCLAKDSQSRNVELIIRGTCGYGAPEYVTTGRLTVKCDVYNYGAVLLELLCGSRFVDPSIPDGAMNLADWVRPYLMHKQKTFHPVDNRLEGQYPLGSAQKVADLALQCLSEDPRLRPDMAQVVHLLEEVEDLKELTEKAKTRSMVARGQQ